jgi:hypothetical protein
MTEPTQTERAQDSAGLAAAALDRGKEQIEAAKGQLADEADRVAAAVDRTADDLEGGGDGALSGFGHSVASLMRQLSGGLRERDVEQFARELGGLARRNPGVFLAGSVALGFGVARFFKARPAPAPRRDDDWEEPIPWRPSEPPRGDREEFVEERLDLSASAMRRRHAGDGEQSPATSDAGAQPSDEVADTLEGGKP